MEDIFTSFGISPNCIFKKSDSFFNCLVPETWLKHVSTGKCSLVPKISPSTYENVDKSLAQLCLARCTKHQLLTGFKKVTIQVIKKENKFVESLIESPLSIGWKNCQVNAKVKSHLDDQYNAVLQLHNRHNYKYAVQHHQTSTPLKTIKHHDSLIREVLTKLFSQDPLFTQHSHVSNLQHLQNNSENGFPKPSYTHNNNQNTSNDICNNDLVENYEIKNNFSAFLSKTNVNIPIKNDNVNTSRNDDWLNHPPDLHHSFLSPFTKTSFNHSLRNPSKSKQTTNPSTHYQTQSSFQPLSNHTVSSTIFPSLNPQSSTLQTPLPPSSPQLHKTTFSSFHPLLAPVYLTCEDHNNFFIFSTTNSFTLSDLVVFSPHKLSSVHSQVFILHQILTIVQELNCIGLNVHSLRLLDFSVDELLSIKLLSLNFKAFYQDFKVDEDVKAGLISTPQYNITLYNLPFLTQKWIYNEISNLDYLLILNRLAGRDTQEPNHHVILPWVLDLSSSSQKVKMRDLTKSKYRLNKGEEQLDLTFDSSTDTRMTQTPFHVSDFLSDISYYVYIARSTPQDVLCRMVRPRWQPTHYPVSIDRLYEWTPDECIPAFYLNPPIFSSIHHDLEDLELPLWTSSPSHFTKLHLAALESNHVSSALHQWINLTFGYQLSGVAAIESKNVCLQLVDKHTTLTNHGVVQLFTKPHPCRKVNLRREEDEELNMLLTEKNDELVNFDLDELQTVSEFSKISFSLEEKEKKEEVGSEIKPPTSKTLTNPLKDLEELEEFYNFSISATSDLSKDFGKDFTDVSTNGKNQMNGLQMALKTRDMITLGCLFTELLCSNLTSQLNTHPTTLHHRYNICKAFVTNHQQQIPLFIKKCLNYLLNNDLFSDHKPCEPKVIPLFDLPFNYPLIYQPLDLPNPSIDIIISPITNIIPISSHFHALFTGILSCIPSTLYDPKIPETYHPCNLHTYHPTHKCFHRWRNCLQNIYKFGHRVNAEIIMQLLLPFIKFFVSGELGNSIAVDTVIYLFYPLYQILGHKVMKENFLKATLLLFNSYDTSHDFLKIYHRSFAPKLIAIFKLQTFLTSFSTPFVEAVSTFKDFETFHQPSSPHELFNSNKSSANNTTSPQNTLETAPKLFENVMEDGNTNLVSNADMSATLNECDNSEGENFCKDNFNNNNNVAALEEDMFYSQGGLLFDEDEEDEDDVIVIADDEDHELVEVFVEEVSGEEVVKSKQDKKPISGSVGSIPITTTAMRTITNTAILFNTPNSLNYSLLNSTSNRSSFNNKKNSLNRSHSYSKNGFGDNSYNNENTNNSNFTSDFTYLDENFINTNSCCLDHNISYTTTTDNNDNISKVASESIDWLTDRLGAVLAVKYLSQNLLRMLTLCYMGQTQQQQHLQLLPQDHKLKAYKSGVVVKGDINAMNVLANLVHISECYGEQIIIGHFFHYMQDLVTSITPHDPTPISNHLHASPPINHVITHVKERSEGCLISCLALLLSILPYLPIHSLIDLLPKITENILHPIIIMTTSQNVLFNNDIRSDELAEKHIVKEKEVDVRNNKDEFDKTASTNIPLVTSTKITNITNNISYNSNTFTATDTTTSTSSRPFNTTARTLLAYRCFDVVAELSCLLGWEMSRLQLSATIKHLFAAFTIVKNLTSHKSTSSVDNLGFILVQDHFSEPGTESSSSLSSAQEKKLNMDPPINNLSPTSEERQHILNDILNTYTPHYAHITYVTFCKLVGGIYMEENLIDHTYVRHLCWLYDEGMMREGEMREGVMREGEMKEGEVREGGVGGERGRDEEKDNAQAQLSCQKSKPFLSQPFLHTTNVVSETDLGYHTKTNLPNVPSAGTLMTQQDTNLELIGASERGDERKKDEEEEEEQNKNDEEDENDDVTISGNKIVVRTFSNHSKVSVFKTESDRSQVLPFPNTSSTQLLGCGADRHVKGHWLAYWQHEIGLSNTQTDFDIKQIKLQTFKGHSAAVKVMTTFDNEASFLTGSKDKTIKLWDIRNKGAGDHVSTCEGTYRGHKRALICLTLLQPRHHVVSSDLTIHLWDPRRVSLIRKWEGCVATTHLTPLPPHHFVASSPSDTYIRFIDVRSCRLSHYFETTIVSTGQVKSTAMGDDGCYIAVAFTSGFVSCLDVRTGAFLGSWKAHEAEIHEMKVIGEDRLVTCGMDGCMNLWSFPAGKMLGQFKGLSENQYWLQHHNNTILTATASQRINSHSLIQSSKMSNQVKLKSDLIKNNLTCFAALPFNHLLLLAADNGDITLIT